MGRQAQVVRWFVLYPSLVRGFQYDQIFPSYFLHIENLVARTDNLIVHRMNLTTIIAELRREKERLDRVIASLEGLQTGATMPVRRRGRKSMSAEERREVSARMTKYWASRRAGARIKTAKPS